MPIESPMSHGTGAALVAPGEPAARPQASRTALALGTVGRVGEELINCLLESPAYSSLHVAVEATLASTLPRLKPWLLEPGAEIALPPVDDVFCCIGGMRSYFGRDRAYFPVRAEQIPALARMAARAGARRFVLLSPLSAFLQWSAPAGGAIHVREMELVGLGFESLVILRPTSDYVAGKGRFLERLIAWGAKTVMEIVIPPRLQPLRARLIAQAAICAATTFDPGVHIVDGRRITELAPCGRR